MYCRPPPLICAPLLTLIHLRQELHHHNSVIVRRVYVRRDSTLLQSYEPLELARVTLCPPEPLDINSLPSLFNQIQVDSSKIRVCEFCTVCLIYLTPHKHILHWMCNYFLLQTVSCAPRCCLPCRHWRLWCQRSMFSRDRNTIIRGNEGGK